MTNIAAQIARLRRRLPPELSAPKARNPDFEKLHPGNIRLGEMKLLSNLLASARTRQVPEPESDPAYLTALREVARRAKLREASGLCKQLASFPDVLNPWSIEAEIDQVRACEFEFARLLKLR